MPLIRSSILSAALATTTGRFGGEGNSSNGATTGLDLLFLGYLIQHAVLIGEPLDNIFLALAGESGGRGFERELATLIILLMLLPEWLDCFRGSRSFASTPLALLVALN